MFMIKITGDARCEVSMLKEFPILQSERLLLRELKIEDACDILSFFSDFDAMKYYGIDMYKNLEDSKAAIKFYRKGFKNRWIIKWAIVKGDPGKVIGFCGYHSWSKGDYRAEISYILSKDYWRMGIMREALSIIIPFGFCEMNLNRIDAVIHVENTTSMELIKGFGFRQEGLLRKYKYYMEGFHDFYMYSLLKDEYTGEMFL